VDGPKGEIVKKGPSLAALGLCVLVGLAGCSFFGDQGPPFVHWEPELSPDGTTLVYESEVEESLELFARDLASGVETRLTTNDAEDWSPSWSPEGDRVAFASSRDDNADIYIVTIDSLVVQRVTTSEADDIKPSWGIDGRIYFNSNRTDTWEIFVIDPDGSNLTMLTKPDATD